MDEPLTRLVGAAELIVNAVVWIGRWRLKDGRRVLAKTESFFHSVLSSAVRGNASRDVRLRSFREALAPRPVTPDTGTWIVPVSYRPAIAVAVDAAARPANSTGRVGV